MKKVKPATVYAHMRTIHSGEIYCRHTILEDHSYFIRQSVCLSTIDSIYTQIALSQDEQLVEAYSLLSTPFPAIVIDYKREVLDGFKRIAAAVKRGDKTILAYVGGVC